MSRNDSNPNSGSTKTLQASEFKNLIQNQGKAKIGGQEWELNNPSYTDANLQTIIKDPRFTAKPVGAPKKTVGRAPPAPCPANREIGSSRRTRNPHSRTAPGPGRGCPRCSRWLDSGRRSVPPRSARWNSPWWSAWSRWYPGNRRSCHR